MEPIKLLEQKFTEEQIKALEYCYQEAFKGSDFLRPSHIVTPEGIILVKDDGSVEILDFDEEGNYFKLTEEEQVERKTLIMESLRK